VERADCDDDLELGERPQRSGGGELGRRSEQLACERSSEGIVKFGTDGVRGLANVELTASFALSLGRAAARVLGVDRAVVGGDTRVSTPMLEAALCAGLASEGLTVEQLGVVPTPAVAYIASRRDALGVVVSASHNPYHDNGIKLFARGGMKLSDDVQRAIEAELEQLPAPAGPVGQVFSDDGSVAADVAAYTKHLSDVMRGRRLDGLTVVVDSANGAAFRLAPAAFRDAGATVISVNDEPDGTNINASCGATDPGSLSVAVVDAGADLGVALDGDGDRLIAVDATGRIVDGDHILAICARDLHQRGELRDDTVVVTVMTNLGFRLAMGDAGISVIETPVGDRYVLEALDRRSLSLGGEQSGHVIFRDHATTGDGTLTALVLADVMARRGVALTTLADEAMTALPQVLVNVGVREPVPDAADRLADVIKLSEAELGESGRVLVRPSGTEPLVRVMVEAATHEQATAIADRLADAARELFT